MAEGQRTSVRQFDSARAGFWDKAVSNSSALQSIFLKEMKIEVANLSGLVFSSNKLDLDAFYDRIDLHVLAPALIKHNYPPHLAALPALMYQAPRRLQEA